MPIINYDNERYFHLQDLTLNEVNTIYMYIIAIPKTEFIAKITIGRNMYIHRYSIIFDTAFIILK